MKKSASKPSPALSGQDAAKSWKRKRRAIYPCVALGLALVIAGFLLRENAAGKPLLAAGLLLGLAAKHLNTACRRCPHCGHINAPAQGILQGFTCSGTDSGGIYIETSDSAACDQYLPTG